MEREAMRQSLRDAGCSEVEIGMILSAAGDENLRELNALIEKYREKLLNQYRRSRQFIDRIDYLSYQLTKESEDK